MTFCWPEGQYISGDLLYKSMLPHQIDRPAEPVRPSSPETFQGTFSEEHPVYERSLYKLDMALTEDEQRLFQLLH
jgi:hypothetical protein